MLKPSWADTQLQAEVLQGNTWPGGCHSRGETCGPLRGTKCPCQRGGSGHVSGIAYTVSPTCSPAT